MAARSPGVITGDGLKVLDALRERIDAALAERFGRLGEAVMRTLIGLLERLRD